MSQTIDQVSAIKTHTGSSKLERFSGTLGHFKVWKFLAVRTVVGANIWQAFLAVWVVVGANILEFFFSCLHSGRGEHFAGFLSCPHGGRDEHFGR